MMRAMHLGALLAAMTTILGCGKKPCGKLEPVSWDRAELVAAGGTICKVNDRPKPDEVSRATPWEKNVAVAHETRGNVANTIITHLEGKGWKATQTSPKQLSFSREGQTLRIDLRPESPFTDATYDLRIYAE